MGFLSTAAALLITSVHMTGCTACPAGQKTLEECFRLFELIHQVTTEHETITAIASQVLEAFAADNVVYLELRTTPKVTSKIVLQLVPFLV